jgi:hypothetical protein
VFVTRSYTSALAEQSRADTDGVDAAPSRRIGTQTKSSFKPLTMADYRIICVNKQAPHGHIESVGTGTNDGYYDQRLTVEQVYNAIDAGHSFHTGSRTGRDYAVVTKFSCAYCGRPTLRSRADGDWNPNLDDLRECN